jgi:hypothetical protein
MQQAYNVYVYISMCANETIHVKVHVDYHITNNTPFEPTHSIIMECCSFTEISSHKWRYILTCAVRISSVECLYAVSCVHIFRFVYISISVLFKEAAYIDTLGIFIFLKMDNGNVTQTTHYSVHVLYF